LLFFPKVPSKSQVSRSGSPLSRRNDTPPSRAQADWEGSLHPFPKYGLHTSGICHRLAPCHCLSRHEAAVPLLSLCVYLTALPPGRCRSNYPCSAFGIFHKRKRMHHLFFFRDRMRCLSPGKFPAAPLVPQNTNRVLHLPFFNVIWH